MPTLSLAWLLVTLLAPPPLQLTPSRAPTPRANETATEFYLRWRSTAQNAKSIDEITSFWTAETIAEFNMEPDSAKAETLTMVKRLYGTQTDVKVVNETATPSGATLSLEALDRDKKPVVSSVDLVKENGAWKVSAAVEQWRPKLTSTADGDRG